MLYLDSMRLRIGVRNQFLLALALSTFVALGLFVVRALRNGNSDHSYLLWNLALAWLPLLLALRLRQELRTKLWSSWTTLGLSLAWLFFLPNSFYMISDIIHLQHAGSVDILFDAVMFAAFVCLGLVLGFSSLYLVHIELKKRLSSDVAASLIGGIIFLSSFAIYIGRDLRWNSWDVLTNPHGLLFDVSDRLLQPSGYGQILITVMSFFVLLAGLYAVLWAGTRLARNSPRI